MDSVSAYGESSLIWILLFGSVVYTYVSVRDSLPSVCWKIWLVDEKQCIRARYTPRDSLSQSSELVAIWFSPQFSILRIFMIFQYSINSPIFWSNIAFNISLIYLQEDNLRGVIWPSYIPRLNNNASAVIDSWQVRLWIFWAGVWSSPSLLSVVSSFGSLASNIGGRRGGGTTLGSGGVRCTVGGAVIGRNGGGNITLGDGATLGVGGFMLSDDVVLWCWGRG